MNFRLNEIAFVGDIKEMFLQVGIREQDRQAQRILWRAMDREKPPEVYEIQVVFFGAKCSPSISQEVRNRNAKEFECDYPQASYDIIHRHYMDDYLGGANTVDDAVKLITDVITVHKKAGFEMCNWLCNSNDVLSQIDPSLVMTKAPKKEIEDDMTEERILGLWWNYKSDEFSYQFKFHKVNSNILNFSQRPTKRDLLKVVMSMFDPLGFLSNFHIVGKILLQSVWESGIGWDDFLNDEHYEIWKNWCKTLSQVTKLTIPRQLTNLPLDKCKIQMHIFCDASQYAYASCVYLRFEHDNKIDCTLVTAKSRVGPLKLTSIPRMELQSALLAARLYKNLKSGLNLKIDQVFFWSDSEVVLNWLRNTSRRFKIYVAHRIGEIKELTNVNDWRYIPSKLNIADDATKLKPVDFSTDSSWLKGPKFLYQQMSTWPQKNKFDLTNDLEQTEYVNFTIEKSQINLPDVTKFSKWLRFLRTTAWILRYVDNLKRLTIKQNPIKSELMPEDIAKAEILICRKIQRDSFPELFQCNSSEQMKYKDRQLGSLPPIICFDDGLLRLKGRMENVVDENFGFDSKHPILLSHKHPITTLIIKYYHDENSHIGHDTVITNLRKIYWITNCRNAVKNVTNNCQMCKNRKAKPKIPMIAQLPSCRVNISETPRPFLKTGVDLFGPLEVTVKRSHEKRYGVLFTCMVTRAIHLEVAEDLSSTTFIECWRRFGCRRGFPEELYSDNGTNFRKADKDIRAAIDNWPNDEITKTMTMRNCKWYFNPPGAPHMGGAWERLIQNVKKHLYGILNEKYPTEKVLRTLFVEVENMVNSRPLTHVPLLSADADPLCPNDILIGPNHKSLQFAKTDDKDLNFLRTWKATQRLSDLFWSRWRNEYRQHILYSRKWSKDNPNIAVGDVVLIFDPDSPRNIWPKGIIEKTYPSNDGRVRIVDVKTVGGVFRRPVTKIIKLDVEKVSIPLK